MDQNECQYIRHSAPPQQPIFFLLTLFAPSLSSLFTTLLASPEVIVGVSPAIISLLNLGGLSQTSTFPLSSALQFYSSSSVWSICWRLSDLTENLSPDSCFSMQVSGASLMIALTFISYNILSFANTQCFFWSQASSISCSISYFRFWQFSINSFKRPAESSSMPNFQQRFVIVPFLNSFMAFYSSIFALSFSPDWMQHLAKLKVYSICEGQSFRAYRQSFSASQNCLSLQQTLALLLQADEFFGCRSITFVRSSMAFPYYRSIASSALWQQANSKSGLSSIALLQSSYAYLPLFSFLLAFPLLQKALASVGFSSIAFEQSARASSYFLSSQLRTPLLLQVAASVGLSSMALVQSATASMQLWSFQWATALLLRAVMLVGSSQMACEKLMTAA